MKIPRKTVVEQILLYCNMAEGTGHYFGNKEQFQKRHKEIVNFIHELLSKYDS
jgi:hypothetical protein